MQRTTQPPSDALDAGWNELDQGNWSAARAAFSRALATTETPEACDGLAWAAWWLDDGPGLFDARERAYRLYQQHGDLAAAGRMATWLAIDHLDFNGALAIADGWLQRARDLLESIEPGPERGWLSFLEGYLALAAGEFDTAAARGQETADLGRRLDVPDLRMLGAALEGATLVARGEVATGMHRLDEATAAALVEHAVFPIANAWTCCFLVSACVSIRDYERAFAWCDRIAAMAERHGSRYLLAFCRADYAVVHLWRAQWPEAETLLKASIEDFSQSRPTMVNGPLVALAELRRRQGRTEDALELLARVGSTVEAHLCRGRLALDTDEPDTAAELAERALRQLAGHDRPGRASALELRVRASLALGQPEDAHTAADELAGLARQVGTVPLQAMAGLCRGMVLGARGEPAAARVALEDAVDGFERSRGLYDAALARLELARILTSLGRRDAAVREAAAARDRLAALGAEPACRLADQLLGRGAGNSVQPLPELTPREREVLALVARGQTNRQIARQLRVSEHTVHRHVTNVLRKLDLPSRTAAAAVAIRAGLADHPLA